LCGSRIESGREPIPSGKAGGRRSVAVLARVVTIRVKPEKMEECISVFREVNAPSVAARPGLDHGHWWVDRTGGQATSVTFWENEQRRASGY